MGGLGYFCQEPRPKICLRAVDEARANFFPTLSASLSGAYLPQPPTGVKVPVVSLGSIPIYNTLNKSYSLLSATASKNGIDAYTENSFFKGSIAFSQPPVAWGKIKAAVDRLHWKAKAADIARRSAEPRHARA